MSKHQEKDQTQRFKRGRVLCIGQSPDYAALSAMLIHHPIHVENVFDALGELTTSPTGKPITTVLLPIRFVKEDEANVLDAIRSIDPSVRLVLITESLKQKNTLGSIINSADALLVTPVSREDWVEVLNGELQDRENESFEDEQISCPPTQTSSPQSENDSNQNTNEPLGDTDLVEAVLSNPQGVLETALQLLRQQTQWNQARVVMYDQSDETSPIPSGVPLIHGDHTFGHLFAEDATEIELKRWAQWLASWLALDHAHRDLRVKAYKDNLTGAWNRRFFDAFLTEVLQQASNDRRHVTVLLFDIDNFKHYNDEYGHEAGDEILIESVRLLKTVVRKGDRVCRIGGDEFAVIFADPEGPREEGSHHPHTVELLARRFQNQVCKMNFPKLGREAPGTLSISGGLATYPWDGHDPASLLRHADQLLLVSKRKGKNVITLGPGARDVCSNGG